MAPTIRRPIDIIFLAAAAAETAHFLSFGVRPPVQVAFTNLMAQTVKCIVWTGGFTQTWTFIVEGNFGEYNYQKYILFNHDEQNKLKKFDDVNYLGH